MRERRACSVEAVARQRERAARAAIFDRETARGHLLDAYLEGIEPGMATQAGLANRRLWVHLGYGVAVAAGLLTWIVATQLVTVSAGRRRDCEPKAMLRPAQSGATW